MLRIAIFASPSEFSIVYLYYSGTKRVKWHCRNILGFVALRYPLEPRTTVRLENITLIRAARHRDAVHLDLRTFGKDVSWWTAFSQVRFRRYLRREQCESEQQDRFDREHNGIGIQLFVLACDCLSSNYYPRQSEHCSTLRRNYRSPIVTSGCTLQLHCGIDGAFVILSWQLIYVFSLFLSVFPFSFNNSCAVGYCVRAISSLLSSERKARKAATGKSAPLITLNSLREN